MIRYFLIFLVLQPVAPIYCLAQTAPKGFEVFEGVAIPSTEFASPSGQPMSLDAYKGLTIVLNLWATWCAPCVKELPSLERLAGKLDAKAAVLAVSQDKGGAAIAKMFLERLGVQKLSAHADPAGRLFRDLGIRGLPTTLIIGPHGLLVARVEGPLEWDSDEVVSYIRSISR